MSAARVLVVDDEFQARHLLRTLLGQQGYQVQTAAAEAEALELAGRSPPDLVVLDPALSHGRGLALCQALRECTPAPIIVVSARTAERAIVEALDHGADDYLTTPFGTEEFLARVRATLRRGPRAAPAGPLASGALRLDPARRQVTRDGEAVHLTPTEYELLQYLMLHAGNVVTHGTLRRAVWGAGYADATSTLRVFIRQLRRKLEADPAAPTYLETVPRVGYRCRAAAAPGQ